MKALRLVLTFLAVAAAAYLAFRGMNPPVPKAPPAQPSDAAPADEPGANLLAGPQNGGAKPPAAPPKSEMPAAPEEEAPTGTPVKPGVDVSLVVPYRTGTKAHYRVDDAQLTRERLANDAAETVHWQQFIWYVSTEVDQGDGDGNAHIQLEISSFIFRTQVDAQRIEFGSTTPDPKLLTADTFGRLLKPLLAILDTPVEFVIDHGVVKDIEGVAAMNRKYLDAVDVLGAAYAKDVSDAPTVENLRERWAEILFPGLGGGTLKPPQTRDLSFTLTYLDRWAAVSAGKIQATHDDPGAFRVEFKGKPEMQELSRAAVNESARGVIKAKVASSADSFVASWVFDRAKGRLARSHRTAKYQLWVSRSAGTDPNGQQQYDPHFYDRELRSSAELLDK